MFTVSHSQVKEKMLYAATKATIRKAFSSGVIVDDIAATHKVREGTFLCLGTKRMLHSRSAGRLQLISLAWPTLAGKGGGSGQMHIPCSYRTVRI